MTSSAILFYLISAFLIGSGILSVTATRVFRSAIWLLFTLLGIAALFFWMQLEFIAAVQIIIYVGGIVVLIIFSIFLTQKSGEAMPKPLFKKALFSLFTACFGFVFTYMLISQYGFENISDMDFNLSVNQIGMEMLSLTDKGYILPFEIISVLLLAAFIGCIVIALKIKTSQE